MFLRIRIPNRWNLCSSKSESFITESFIVFLVHHWIPNFSFSLSLTGSGSQYESSESLHHLQNRSHWFILLLRRMSAFAAIQGSSITLRLHTRGLNLRRPLRNVIQLQGICALQMIVSSLHFWAQQWRGSLSRRGDSGLCTIDLLESQTRLVIFVSLSHVGTVIVKFEYSYLC